MPEKSAEVKHTHALDKSKEHDMRRNRKTQIYMTQMTFVLE